MATLLQIANVLRSDTAKQRVFAALLQIGETVNNELFVVTSSTSDEDIARENKRKNAARYLLRSPQMATELMLGRILASSTLRAKAGQMVSTSLDATTEAALDADIIAVCDDILDDFIDVIPEVP